MIYIRDSLQLFSILLVWLASGWLGGPAAFVVVPFTLLLLYKKDLYEELLFGFLFVLILSDSLLPQLVFAKDLKNIYIAMLAFFFFRDLPAFRPLNRIYVVFIPFTIFSFLTIFSSIAEPFFFTGLQKTISYFLVMLIIPNIVCRLYREQGSLFVRNLILFGVVLLLAGFALNVVAPNITHLESGRYRGVMGNPNGLGIFSVLFFMLVFVLFDLFPSLFSRWQRWAIYAIILISILMTDSRNAIFSIVIFFVFQRFFALSPVIGFIAFLGTVAAYEFITSNFTQIILSLGLGEYFRINTLEEGSGRYIAWEFAWKQIQYNFFFGKGFAYNEFYMRQNYGILQRMGHQGGIHNSFLTFWFDQGLIGLLIYLRSFLLIFIKGAKRSRFAFPVLFTVSFSAIFESWLVGSLSAYAFMANVLFTVIYSDDFQREPENQNDQVTVNEI